MTVSYNLAKLFHRKTTKNKNNKIHLDKRTSGTKQQVPKPPVHPTVHVPVSMSTVFNVFYFTEIKQKRL